MSESTLISSVEEILKLGKTDKQPTWSVIVTILPPKREIHSSVAILNILNTDLSKEEAIKKCEEYTKASKNPLISIRAVLNNQLFFLNPGPESDEYAVSDDKTAPIERFKMPSANNGDLNNLDKKYKKIDEILSHHSELKKDKNSDGYQAQLWWNLFRQESTVSYLSDKIAESNNDVSMTKVEIDKGNLSAEKAVEYFRETFKDINNENEILAFEEWVKSKSIE